MKRNKPLVFNILVAVITFVVQALLVATPFIPATAGFWHVKSQSDFNNSLAAFLGLELLLVTTAVTIMLLKGAKDQSDGFSEMRSALPLTLVRRLTDSEFYKEFLFAVGDARHTVCIAYLAPYPPADVGYKHRKKYDEQILQFMKQRTDVTFKRLIRDSPSNREWISGLMRELKDKPNVDIALLSADLAPEKEMGLTMSVQLVDDDKTWLVALKAHEMEGDFRDIYIENPDVAAALRSYYDRIWKTATLLLSRGRLTGEGSELLQEAKGL